MPSKNSKQWESEALNRFQYGASSALFVGAVRARPFKIYIPGAPAALTPRDTLVIAINDEALFGEPCRNLSELWRLLFCVGLLGF